MKGRRGSHLPVLITERALDKHEGKPPLLRAASFSHERQYQPCNTAIGFAALFSNTTGFENTAVGPDALFYSTPGGLNTAIGWGALEANTTGSLNTV